MNLWPLMLALAGAVLVAWLGNAYARYQKSLTKPQGKDKDEWLLRALSVAEGAERLLNPDWSLWLHSGSRMTPELRQQYVAHLYRHMREYLRSEQVSITFTRRQVPLLLAQRTLGLKGRETEEEDEAESA